jgi:hypothetical protein
VPGARPTTVSYVYFETAFSSALALPIWSWAYVAMAAAVIVSPLRRAIRLFGRRGHRGGGRSRW